MENLKPAYWSSYPSSCGLSALAAVTGLDTNKILKDVRKFDKYVCTEGYGMFMEDAARFLYKKGYKISVLHEGKVSTIAERIKEKKAVLAIRVDPNLKLPPGQTVHAIAVGNNQICENNWVFPTPIEPWLKYNPWKSEKVIAGIIIEDEPNPIRRILNNIFGIGR